VVRAFDGLGGIVEEIIPRGEAWNHTELVSRASDLGKSSRGSDTRVTMVPGVQCAKQHSTQSAGGSRSTRDFIRHDDAPHAVPDPHAISF